MMLANNKLRLSARNKDGLASRWENPTTTKPGTSSTAVFDPGVRRRRCAYATVSMAAVACLVSISSIFVPASAWTQTTPGREPPLDSLVVSQFRDMIFIHGVDYEWARQLGPGALPTLRRLLTMDDFRVQWPHIVATIAYIGRPQDFETIRSFLWDRFRGEVDLRTFNALMAALGALGTVQHPDVVNYLSGGTDPGFWTGIPWSYGHYRSEALHLLLSKLSINSLSWTGSPRAREVLKRLKVRPYSARQRSNIEEGIVRNDEIAAKGLVQYLHQRAAARH